MQSEASKNINLIKQFDQTSNLTAVSFSSVFQNCPLLIPGEHPGDGRDGEPAHRDRAGEEQDESPRLQTHEHGGEQGLR